MTIGEFALANAAAGHSTNCCEVEQKDRLDLVFPEGAVCADAMQSAEKQHAARDGSSPGDAWRLRDAPGATILEAPYDLAVDVAFGFPAHRRRLEFRVMSVQEILADDGPLEPRRRLPGETPFQLAVRRHGLIDDLPDVAKSEIQLQIRRQVQRLPQRPVVTRIVRLGAAEGSCPCCRVPGGCEVAAPCSQTGSATSR